MGSRGAFENIDSGSVKAPEYSHSANRSYAIVQNGKGYSS